MIDVIKSRRSTRAFLGRAVPFDTLLMLLDSARWAPSGGNRQPWLFVIVEDETNIQKVKMFSPGLHGDPPVLFVLCDDTSVEGSSHLMDIAMAGQNIMLAATEKGLGTCAVRSFNQKALRVLLHLPPHVVPELIISVGYPAKSVKTPYRKAIEDIAHWEGYGERPDGERRARIAAYQSDMLCDDERQRVG